MSRSQQNQTFQTAQQENQGYNQNAQNAFQKAQQGVTDYGSQLAKFQAANPYVQGGQMQTVQNQQLADVSQGTADATKQAVEGAAARTGSNMGGAVAGAEQVAQQNQRTLGGQVANANAQRIGAEAGYNQTALGGYQTEQQMQDQLAQQQASAAQGAMGTQEQAAKQPSFGDMLGQGLINAGSSFAQGFGGKMAGCWIAAELYGGWEDPRTVLVRMWLSSEFRRRWYGPLVLAAYSRWGERMATRIRTGMRLRTFFRTLFDEALRQATAWQEREAYRSESSLYSEVR